MLSGQAVSDMIFQRWAAAAAMSGSLNDRGGFGRWELAQRKINKKDKTTLTPLHVNPCELYCTPVMFAWFVCALFIFRARKFPAKSETGEPGKIIVKCTSYHTNVHFPPQSPNKILVPLESVLNDIFSRILVWAITTYDRGDILCGNIKP